MRGYSPHERKPLLGNAALTAAPDGLAAAAVFALVGASDLLQQAWNAVDEPV